MATIPPNIIGMIFAKRVEINVEHAEFSLIGLFHRRYSTHFPTNHLEMIVFAMVNGGRGEGILQLSVHHLNSIDDFEVSHGWIYRQRRWVKFLDDPNQMIMIEMHVRKLVFLEPGEYLFVLTIDGKPITERRMSVLESEVSK